MPGVTQRAGEAGTADPTAVADQRGRTDADRPQAADPVHGADGVQGADRMQTADRVQGADRTQAADARTARRPPAPEPGAPARRRVAIESVSPEVDGGRFAVKRTVGEEIVVEADAFTDGHDRIACVLRYRRTGDCGWGEVRMEPIGDDRWRGRFRVTELGRWVYTIEAWIDEFETWRADVAKRVEAGQDPGSELTVGARLLLEAAARSAHETELAERLRLRAASIAPTDEISPADEIAPADEQDSAPTEAARRALAADLSALMARVPDRRFATTYGRELEVVVDRERARCGAWYEMFPRSCGGHPGASGHGTFADCEARLPYIAGMGFDVVYLPPIHPIGRTHRKGSDNHPVAGPEDVGSPWAIGGEAGGHKAVHPRLGSLDDFRRFRRAAEGHGLEVALDIAFQCSPDHPYVGDHPEWFAHRPDGSIRYAENPPKKYEDIYPFDFETDDWRALWEELKSIFDFWIAQGVRIFRVDNPHTKPFPFWEWVIGEIKDEDPGVIFLSEAFTRPKVMYRLAKLGFTQSYTYFAWRNTRAELTEYFTELTGTPVREFFRPSLWPNTPDILTEALQTGGRAALRARLVLAATLGANYGIYGPAYELGEVRPQAAGSEEYLDSEKYQVRRWNLDAEHSEREFITRINRIRRENPGLHSDRSLRFHATDNDRIIGYSKRDPTGGNLILVFVNLDPHHAQSGWTDLDLEVLGLPASESWQVHDLLAGGRYGWRGARNFVRLDPEVSPAHIFRVERRMRTERDFDYYM